MSSPYSKGYYERLKEDSALSAAAVVPVILRLLSPRSVIDVGCGSGTWTKVYRDSGVSVLGIDGAVVREDQLLIPPAEFQRVDLGKPFGLKREFDLVNCLEVAEHLDESRADGFVADLCRLGPIIVFSAAIPGQGGTHHVNEQWPAYWLPKFAAQGYEAIDCLRPRIWNHPDVAWWYAQNMFVLARQDRVPVLRPQLMDGLPPILDLCHPRAYMTATVPRQMSPRMLLQVLKALPYFPGKVLKFLGK